MLSGLISIMPDSLRVFVRATIAIKAPVPFGPYRGESTPQA